MGEKIAIMKKGVEKMDVIKGHHHITLCVGGAQEDYDFHTQLLGLRSVKKTVLFDGTAPIYHLYYGNETGDPSTLVTTFPMRQSGRKGRKGSGQVKILALSVPSASLDFWSERLNTFGYQNTRLTRFDEQRVHFEHPCGIEYELVGDDADERKPWTTEDTPTEVAVRGVHSITVSVQDLTHQAEFMDDAFGFRKTVQDGPYTRSEVKDGGAGRIVEHVLEPDVGQGSWTFGEGIVHHCAFRVDGNEPQLAFRDYVEGMGYTDVSDVKDRKYFYSVYVRTPGGTLFEAANSVADGFMIDEPKQDLGKEFQLPPWYEDRRQELIGALEPIEY